MDGGLVLGYLYAVQLSPVAELDGNNNVVSHFMYGSRSNVPDDMLKGGVSYRIVSDHLGSPRLVVNTATGEVVQRLEYDEYGRVLLDTNPGFQPFGFAGGLYDHDTKLVRCGYRDYDPETGKRLSTARSRVTGLATSSLTHIGSDRGRKTNGSGTGLMQSLPNKLKEYLGLQLPSGWDCCDRDRRFLPD